MRERPYKPPFAGIEPSHSSRCGTGDCPWGLPELALAKSTAKEYLSFPLLLCLASARRCPDATRTERRETPSGFQ